MEENEYSNIYVIPANYTDSGKIFGGLLEVRNAAETVFLLLRLGSQELMFLAVPLKYKIVLMTLTLLPAGVLSMMGIDGDSLFQYIGHIFRFFLNRRKLHYRRVGYRYDERQLKKRGTRTKGKAKKKGRGKAGTGKQPAGKRRKKRGQGRQHRKTS